MFCMFCMFVYIFLKFDGEVELTLVVERIPEIWSKFFLNKLPEIEKFESVSQQGRKDLVFCIFMFSVSKIVKMQIGSYPVNVDVPSDRKS